MCWWQCYLYYNSDAGHYYVSFDWNDNEPDFGYDEADALRPTENAAFYNIFRAITTGDDYE